MIWHRFCTTSRVSPEGSDQSLGPHFCWDGRPEACLAGLDGCGPRLGNPPFGGIDPSFGTLPDLHLRPPDHDQQLHRPIGWQNWLQITIEWIGRENWLLSGINSGPEKGHFSVKNWSKTGRKPVSKSAILAINQSQDPQNVTIFDPFLTTFRHPPRPEIGEDCTCRTEKWSKSVENEVHF